MKKIIALLVSAAAGCTTYAQSSVTLYGLLDLAVSRSQTGAGTTLPGGTVATASSQNQYRLDSGVAYGSRLGFRGTEDLGAGLRANFLMEMGVAADTGGLNQGGLAFGRQIFVGLENSNWSLTAGRQYTPMNAAVASFEALNGGYWGNVTAQAVAAYESIGATAGDGTPTGGRADNSLMGTLSSGGLTGKLMVTAGNENSRGTGQLINASVAYTSGPLSATAVVGGVRQGAAMITTTASPEWMRSWMVGAKYDFGVAKVFAGAYQFTGPQNFANLSSVATLGAPGASTQAYTWDKNRILWLGASVPMGPGVLLAQVARETFPYAGASDGAATILGLAYDYYLSRRTVVYASYGQVTNNGRARVPLYGAIPLVGPNGFGSDPRAISVGVRHSF